MARRTWSSVVLATVVALASACAPRAAAPSTTLAPLIAPGQLPTTTGAPTTTAAASSDPANPLLVAVPEGECAYTDPLPGGELTFVVGDRLYGVAPDGTAGRCLSTIAGSERGVVRWSPRGDRALLNHSTIFDGGGRRQSGFLADNVRVRWVQPAADALIGPTSSSRTLVRRGASDGARSEVTFLATTDVAVSHPAGGTLVGAGTARDGSRGVFVATDTGADPQPVLSISAPDVSVTELAVDAGGSDVYVLTGGGSAFRLRRLTFPDLSVADVTSEQSPIGELVTGPVTGAVAWRSGLCNSVTRVRVVDERTPEPVEVGEGTPVGPLSLSPAGWLDINRLVLAARPLGCDGPADVWIWNRLDNSATLVVKSVDFPAVRVLAQSAQALAITPTAPVPVV